MSVYEVPSYLKGFDKLFRYFDYSYSFNTVWNGFLSYTVSRLCSNFDNHSTFKPKELEKFESMFECLVDVYERAGSWKDPLGDYYQLSHKKQEKQDFEQFFTPKVVCDLMATSSIGVEKPIGKKIFDPACGSGRLLLAMNDYAPNNLLFGVDLDITCVMMCVINLYFYKAQAEVVCKDALDNTHYRIGFDINVGGNKVVQIEKEASYIFTNGMMLNKQHEEVLLSVPVPHVEKIKQVSLW